MVDQATQMNGRHDSNSAAGNAVAISHELVRLAELQLRLFLIEGRQAARKLVVTIALASLAIAILIGGSIAGIAGIALFLDAHTSLSTWGAFTVTGAAALVLTIILAWGAVAVFQANADKLFQRSVKALSTNVECLKSVLSRQEGR